MLGYGMDSHTYRVFNLFHHKVVETVDVWSDETNSSQREHLPHVLDELPPSESIRLMETGDIIPTEEQGDEEVVIPAPVQREDNAQCEDNADPEDNAANGEDNAQQQQSLRLVHPRVANEV